MHRFKYTKLTKEQIGTKLKAAEGGPKISVPRFSTRFPADPQGPDDLV